MQIMVTFRQVEPSEGLRRHAEEKIQRIHKFLRRPIEAHVTLSVVKRRHIAEVQLSAKHLNLTATEETGDLYSAIDLAMTKLERQVKKHVAKRKNHKGSIDPTAVTAGPGFERTARLIRTRRVAVKPMTLDEAVVQLRLQKAEFLVFKNAANEALTVIYRRKDGHFGLVEPEPS
jgi:putative sigma-54 modulation protein